MALLENRLTAAEELARHLTWLHGEQPLVLGIANGGVPVAEVIARSLDAPLDVLLLERLTAPKLPNQIVGVVDEFGRISMIESTARWHHLSSQQMVGPACEAFKRVQRKRGKVRSVLPTQDVFNRTVVIVDQGVDTGAAMLGAVASVHDRGARKIIVAAPAGAATATWQLNEGADQVVIPHRPSHFKSVPELYEQYTEVSDDVLLAILEKWVKAHPAHEAVVQTMTMKLMNEYQHSIFTEIDLPPSVRRGSGPYPAVIFAHGFESDAQSPRNLPISRRLAARNIIGVRLDFTGHGRSEGSLEEANGDRMLGDLALVHKSVAGLQEVDPDRIALVGSGTGGMLALTFAAYHPEFNALVIRGPISGGELEAVHNVRAPTLLVHAERDTALEDAVQQLDRELSASHELLRIPDSSRLFSDPISLELMIDASVDWLADHLRSTKGSD